MSSSMFEILSTRLNQSDNGGGILIALISIMASDLKYGRSLET